jgi:integrase
VRGVLADVCELRGLPRGQSGAQTNLSQRGWRGLLAGDGGLRRGEIIGLDLADVDFRGGRFTPRRSVYWKKRVRYVDEVKGLDAKPVPCTPRLLDALKACRHLRGSRVLYTADARELTPKLVKLWVMRAERRAGLPETGRMHVYRHTFASHLAMAGVPAKTIQELARHRSFAATMRYMHLSPSAKDEGISMLVRSRVEGGRSVAVGAPSAGETLGETVGQKSRK